MTPRERRAFAVASILLLAASGIRALHEARRGPPVLPPDSAGIRDSLAGRNRAAAAEEARRGRPLDDGERLDPNRAPEVELDRLPGVGPAVARAIVEARDTGPPFRRSGDLARVRGIGAATLSRIAPHLDLSRAPPLGASRAAGAAGAAPRYRPLLEADPARGSGAADAVVDVNRADRPTLETLPGIGPALADRIVDARERRGGFRSVDDLLEVRGIGPATLERIRPRVRVGR